MSKPPPFPRAAGDASPMPSLQSLRLSHLTSPVIAAAPPLVAARLMEGPAQEPRTQLDHSDSAAHTYHFVQRSAVFRFADDIFLWLQEVPGGTCPVVYSKARLGYSDLGVNRRRVLRWVKALSGEGQA